MSDPWDLTEPQRRQLREAHATARRTPSQATDPEAMPTAVHGEPVVSAFRHGPLYGQLDDTYTVITRDGNSPAARYSVFRARFAPALGRWSIDTDYEVRSGLTWTRAASAFSARVALCVS